jgi:sulfonate transport system ATP-binding protein
MSGETRLEISGLRKGFATADGELAVLDGIDLAIEPGSFVCIVGGSGCGKSTLLRIIAGLDLDYQGSVRLGGSPITGPGLDRGFVFQEPRLFPWLTVEGNVGFGLAGRPDREQLVRQHIALVGLKGFERSFPNQLSGGMAQRAAIARALVGLPQVLLLDEPFGALDALTRIRMQQEVLRIWEAERTTVILVTHDIDEAVYLGDRVVVLSPRPGTVRRVVPVDLPRPRDRASLEFTRIRQAIHGEFFTREAQPAPAYSI